MRTRALLLVAVALAAPVAGLGIDAPHTRAVIPNATGCADCHIMHGAPGATLLAQPDGFTACTTCHNNLGAGFTFGGKWYSSDEAAPNAGGRSHHASGSTTSDAYGAAPPASPALLAYSSDGQLQCKTCHDPHSAGAANAPANMHVSVATGTALTRAGGAGSGTAHMALTVGGSAVAKGYRVRIGPATNQFQVSHGARALNVSTITWGAAYPFSAGTSVSLTHVEDDPAVAVTFDSVPSIAGDYWDFYVGFPFLRASMVEGAMCVDCHAARDQRHADVETTARYGWASGRPFSHPVAEGLDANAMHYDLPAPLAPGGAPQGAAASSDLALSTSGKVTCLTCHAVHNADSNSQTVDAR